jgi:transcriptional regulator with XRE-family HTH domain
MDADEMRAARLARGWTQRELAERLGVAMRTVNAWEHGARPSRLSMVRVDTVLRAPAGTPHPHAPYDVARPDDPVIDLDAHRDRWFF